MAIGRDERAACDVTADDAVLDDAQSDERIRGSASTASRQA
ncbi:MAG: hypothetical protein ABIZ72_09540 [Candidatus Limnocylindrales bacterium]